MFDFKNFTDNIFNTTESNFEEKALDLFDYQYDKNPLYNVFCNYLNRTPKTVKKLENIPFLPIEFFKTHIVKTDIWETSKIFKSSGTTGMSRSQHHVRDEKFYHQIAIRTFEDFYGPLESWEIMALLPSYIEQGESSLVSMVDAFMKKSHPSSQYYLNNYEQLTEAIQASSRQKLLIGVSYALLDLSERGSLDTNNLVVMETGGMKGRRKEMIKSELHQEIMKGINVDKVHSEYGMSELTSQAYGSQGTFKFPNWAQVMIRDTNDPLTLLGENTTGGINIIDFGNVNSCAFIATQDLGKKHSNGTFEVLGRFDNSDIRGCNLLIQ